jgi:mannose-6-phosphate isomerase
MHETFPWLIKCLDARDWLSVQVHPDETAARRLLPSEGSKTEAWFILEADPGSRVYAGLRPGTDQTSLLECLNRGAIADCLHSFEPRPGDCVFLPAGTVHAVGGGVLMVEVQQTSDATFRLFDWNRRDAQGKTRPLHIDESLACIDWDGGPVRPVSVPGAAGSPNHTITDHRQTLVECPYFILEYVRSREPFVCGGDGRLRALMMIQGKGRLAGCTAEDHLACGQVWLLPASMPTVEMRPSGPVTVLLCSLPPAKITT